MPIMTRAADDRTASWLSWGFFLGGLTCLLLTACMNWVQGDAMGVTASGKLLSSLSSVVVDVVGLVMFGMAAGACWAAKRWMPALVFTGVMLASAVWSTTAMISFQATERISAAATREKQIARADDIDTFAKGQARWLRDQSIKVDTRASRKDFLAAASGEVEKLRGVEVKTFMLPDAGAKVIADVTGYRIDQVQISLVSYLAMLLILLQAMCFPASAFFWAPLGPAAGKRKEIISGGGGGDGGSKKPEPKKDEKPAAAAATPTPLRIVSSGPEARQPLDAFLQEQLARGRKFESQRAIAKQSGWSEPTVSKTLKKLSKEGKLSRNLRDGKTKTIRQRLGDGGSRHVAHA